MKQLQEQVAALQAERKKEEEKLSVLAKRAKNAKDADEADRHHLVGEGGLSRSYSRGQSRERYGSRIPVSYTHLRAHETDSYL
eukprot:5462447-Pleurochrysis_carterae.AAC.1